MHFTKQRHEHGGLAGSGRSNDEIERAFLEDELFVYVEAERLLRRGQSTVGGLVGPGIRGFAETDVLEMACG